MLVCEGNGFRARCHGVGVATHKSEEPDAKSVVQLPDPGVLQPSFTQGMFLRNDRVGGQHRQLGCRLRITEPEEVCSQFLRTVVEFVIAQSYGVVASCQHEVQLRGRLHPAPAS